MRVLIPTEDDSGISACVSDHFGSAPYFIIIDVETRATEVVRNPSASGGHGHEHGHGGGGGHGPADCRPLHSLDLPMFDAVVCRGIGRRALESLQAAGLEVLAATGRRVEEVAREVKEGTTKRLSSVDACGGRRR